MPPSPIPSPPVPQSLVQEAGELRKLQQTNQRFVELLSSTQVYQIMGILVTFYICIYDHMGIYVIYIYMYIYIYIC